VQNAKQAVLQGYDMTLEQGMELERRLALKLEEEAIPKPPGYSGSCKINDSKER
jgi:hypothetical protein